MGEFAAAMGRDPAGALVALDFDGTLAPIVADPVDARPLPGLLPTLGSLGSRGVRVVLVTGREPRVAARLAGLADPGRPAGLRDLVVHGHYGLQTWAAADGALASTVAPEAVDAVARVREQLPGLLRRLEAPPGVAVEDKDVSLVVHTRRAPEPQATLDRLRGPLTELATSAGLVVQPGRLVLELRPGGVDKGTTLRALLDSRPTAAALYAGDDVGDLPALEVLAQARRAGTATVGLVSGQDGTPPEVAAAADLVVDGPPGVLAVLAELAR